MSDAGRFRLNRRNEAKAITTKVITTVSHNRIDQLLSSLMGHCIMLLRNYKPALSVGKRDSDVYAYGVTVIVASIEGWNVQVIMKVPAVGNVTVCVSPPLNGSPLPDN